MPLVVLDGHSNNDCAKGVYSMRGFCASYVLNLAGHGDKGRILEGLRVDSILDIAECDRYVACKFSAFL